MREKFAIEERKRKSASVDRVIHLAYDAILIEGFPLFRRRLFMTRQIVLAFLGAMFLLAAW